MSFIVVQRKTCLPVVVKVMQQGKTGIVSVEHCGCKQYREVADYMYVSPGPHSFHP